MSSEDNTYLLENVVIQRCLYERDCVELWMFDSKICFAIHVVMFISHLIKYNI